MSAAETDVSYGNWHSYYLDEWTWTDDKWLDGNGHEKEFYWWNGMKQIKWNEMEWNEVKWSGMGGHKTCEMKERDFFFFFGKYRVSGVPDFHPIFSV